MTGQAMSEFVGAVMNDLQVAGFSAADAAQYADEMIERELAPIVWTYEQECALAEQMIAEERGTWDELHPDAYFPWSLACPRCGERGIKRQREFNGKVACSTCGHRWQR